VSSEKEEKNLQLFTSKLPALSKLSKERSSFFAILTTYFLAVVESSKEYGTQFPGKCEDGKPQEKFKYPL
jgi:hypothetical protein